MIIIGLSDIHGSLAYLDRLGEELSQADLILIAGDLTHFGGRQAAEGIIRAFKAYHKPLFAVAGNCDKRDVEELLTEQGVGLHRRVLPFGGYSLVGLSGSNPFIIPTPYTFTEKEYRGFLEELDPPSHSFPLLAVVHNPPHGTEADFIRGKHVGSRVIRDFLDSHHPLLCLCGHIHESPCVQKLEGTTIVNPGPFSQGNYARIEVRETAVQAERKRVE